VTKIKLNSNLSISTNPYLQVFNEEITDCQYCKLFSIYQMNYVYSIFMIELKFNKDTN